MRWLILTAFLLAATLVVAQEQSSVSPPQTSPTQQPSPDAQQPTDDTPQKKSLGKRIKDKVTDPWCVHVAGSPCYDVSPKSKKSDGDESDQQQVAQQKPPGPGKNAPTPRSDAPSHDGEFSSSRDTAIDLSPPRNDAKLHPNSSTDPDDDVQEVHKWDPHRAAKDVEVGDWYYHQKNYVGALSRYEEALEYKPNDAIATFHLAETEEKLQQLDEAREHYAAYLKILPEGPYAAAAHKALQRLGAPPAK